MTEESLMQKMERLGHVKVELVMGKAPESKAQWCLTCAERLQVIEKTNTEGDVLVRGECPNNHRPTQWAVKEHNAAVAVLHVDEQAIRQAKR